MKSESEANQQALHLRTTNPQRPTDRAEVSTVPPAVIEVASVPISVTSLSDITAILASTPRITRGISIRLINAYTIALTGQDPEYARVMRDTKAINLPDGKPVHWVMRRQATSTQTPGRVRGPSLFVKTLEASQETPIRHFLLGASQESLDKLTHEINRRFPKAQIVGTYSPPFQPITDNEMIHWVSRIRDAKPTIVWVSLGTPKQDFATTFLSQNYPAFFIGVGAAFDFLAGSRKEAPRWIQFLALEWMFRLMCEPRRLWRRYLIGNLQFARMVIGK